MLFTAQWNCKIEESFCLVADNKYIEADYELYRYLGISIRKAHLLDEISHKAMQVCTSLTNDGTRQGGQKNVYSLGVVDKIAHTDFLGNLDKRILVIKWPKYSLRPIEATVYFSKSNKTNNVNSYKLFNLNCILLYQ